jgi:hypothetical protein
MFFGKYWEAYRMPPLKQKEEREMSERWVQHIGDDQLVCGMPKHMSSVGAKKQNFGSIPGDPPYRTVPKKEGKVKYWTVHPKANACEKCQSVKGIKFEQKPDRPHPNCKCEIREHEHTPQKKCYSGFIKGFEGNVVKQFFCMGLVKVRIKHITGALGSGVHVYSNLDGVRQAHTLGKDVSFTFSTLTDTPVLWSIHIVQKGADNTVVQYRIEYEEW